MNQGVVSCTGMCKAISSVKSTQYVVYKRTKFGWDKFKSTNKYSVYTL